MLNCLQNQRAAHNVVAAEASAMMLEPCRVHRPVMCAHGWMRPMRFAGISARWRGALVAMQSGRKGQAPHTEPSPGCQTSTEPPEQGMSSGDAAAPHAPRPASTNAAVAKPLPASATRAAKAGPAVPSWSRMPRREGAATHTVQGSTSASQPVTSQLAASPGQAVSQPAALKARASQAQISQAVAPQLLVPQAGASRSSGAASRSLQPRQLSAAIKACRDLGDLQHLIRDHISHMDHIHVSAALHRLAVVAASGQDGRQRRRRPGTAKQEAGEQVKDRAMGQAAGCINGSLNTAGARSSQHDGAPPSATVPAASPTAAVASAALPAALAPAWAPAAALDSAPGQHQQETALQAVGAIDALNRDAAATRAYEWEEEVELLLSRATTLQAAMGWREGSSLLWALATLQHRPRESGYIASLLAHIEAVGFSAADAQALSNTLWALAKLGIVPDAAWVEGLLQAVLRCGDSLRAQHMSNILYALASLAICPPKPWLSSFLKLVLNAIARADQHLGHLSLDLQSAPELQEAPDLRLVSDLRSVSDLQPAPATFFPSAATQIQRADMPLDPHALLLPQQFANVLYALAVLQYRPSGVWLQRYWAVTARMLRHWQYVAAPRGGTRHARGVDVSQPALPQSQAGDLVPLPQQQSAQQPVQAAAPPPPPPPQQQQAALQPAQQPSQALTQLTGQQAGQQPAQPAVQASVEQGGALPPGWASQLQGTLQPQHLSNMLWAAAKLKCPPPAQWIDAYEAQLLRQAWRMSAQELSNTLYAYASLRITPAAPSLLQQLCSSVLRRRHELTPQGLGNLVWALARLHMHEVRTTQDVYGDPSALAQAQQVASQARAQHAASQAQRGFHGQTGSQTPGQSTVVLRVLSQAWFDQVLGAVNASAAAAMRGKQDAAAARNQHITTAADLSPLRSNQKDEQQRVAAASTTTIAPAPAAVTMGGSGRGATDEPATTAGGGSWSPQAAAFVLWGCAVLGVRITDPRAAARLLRLAERVGREAPSVRMRVAWAVARLGLNQEVKTPVKGVRSGKRRST